MSSFSQTASTECSSSTEIEILRLAMDPTGTIFRRLSAIHAWRSPHSKRLRPVDKSDAMPPPPSKKSHELFRISDGALELTKWIAMVIMTADHINKYLFDESLPFIFEFGRTAMPLFVFVLTYNLARPSSNINGGAYLRTARRLALCGLISSVPYSKLGGLLDDWYPLNIFFTLLVITTVAGLIEQSRTGKVRVPAVLTALAAFVMGGGLVEFWWPAVGLGVGAWIYFRSGNLLGLLTSVASCASLRWVNGNHWALAAFPILFILSRLNVQMPRLRWFFYAYYPVHLMVLLLVRIPMERAGYVFWYT
ncbi:hypothetical protein TWF730_008960 [Orbilia blumenaviensis]|uniref:Conjugal transfer protein TraX n=1 Tax=Orbilia blumenaviensis TaxID=1796055 RepID=A0AAV9UY78_9PEZI